MMESLGLLVGHMLGDYILQNDWQAQNKTSKSLHCTVHCLLYTLCVWTCSFWWMPWWGIAVCFATHWPIDRFRFASWWMKNISGQASFATGPLSPWSIIVVDNTFHITTLFAIGVIAL